jgi:RNA polymerase sigma factor (sigma-70 family)
MDASADEGFTEFFETAEPKLRRALISLYGADVGSEASADALGWGWQNWARLGSMQNPVGYLYRVGQTSARRHLSKNPVPVDRGQAAHARLPELDPGLRSALVSMPRNQRVAVVMVHGYGYRHQDVADLLDCSASSVANHVQRGMAKLRKAMGVFDYG